MSPKITLVLMFLFMALGSISLFDPFQWKQKKEEAAERESRVFWLKDKKLESIRIASKGQNILLKCKSADGCVFDATASWEMVSPVQDLGDASTISSLASSILNLTFQEKLDFDSSPDPKEFGLGPEQTKVELKLKGQEAALALSFGRAAAVGPNVYLLTSEQPHRLYTVGNILQELADKDVFYWRNKRLFPDSTPEAITRIDWQAKAKFSATKSEGKWSLGSVPGDPIMLESLASVVALSSAKKLLGKASEVKPKDLQLSLDFYEGKKMHSLKLFKGAQVQVGEMVFAVQDQEFARFQKDALEYRQRKLFPGKGSLEEMVLKFPRSKSSITLTNVAGKWETKAKTEELSQQRIASFVSALMESEAKEFRKSSFGSQIPDVVVAFKGEKEIPFLVENRKQVVAPEGENEVRVFGEDLLKVLPIRIQDLWVSSNKQVITQKGDDAKHDLDSPGHAH